MKAWLSIISTWLSLYILLLFRFDFIIHFSKQNTRDFEKNNLTESQGKFLNMESEESWLNHLVIKSELLCIKSEIRT